MEQQLTKQQLRELLPQDPELQQKLNALSDDELAAVTAGASLYESSPDVNRNSWFVTLLTRLIGGSQQDQNSAAPAGQRMQ